MALHDKRSLKACHLGEQIGKGKTDFKATDHQVVCSNNFQF